MFKGKFIEELIRGGESDHLEIFVSVNLDTIAKTVCAFLNTVGGKILIGIENDNIIGINNPQETADKVYYYLMQQIVPKTILSVTTEMVADKSILVVEVVIGSKQPYIYDGSIFYRVGSETIKANSDQISQLIHNRQEAETHWERQIASGATVEDLDQSEILRTLDRINKSGRVPAVNRDPIEFLSNYGLYRSGDITNAAIVLFANKPTQYLPQCRIRLAVLANSKTDSFIVSDKILEGNLFQNVEYIQHFLESYTGVSSQFDSNQWQRIDRPRFPIHAVREGIMNALIHRDYSNVSGSVSIIYYPDRLEIINTGSLPKELSANDLKKSHLSLPHNPDIAQICFLNGLIEKIGRGTLMIVEEFFRARLKEPKWTSNDGIVTLTFQNKASFKESRDIDVAQLNDRQIKITNMVAPGGSISVIDYLHYIEMPLTDRSARNDLALIVEGGWFVKQGSGRSTRYFRTDKILSLP